VLEQAAHVVGLGDVSLHRDGAAAGGSDGAHHFVRLGGVAGIIDHHGKAVLGQALGDGSADAAGCAGDDSYWFHGLAPSMCDWDVFSIRPHMK
jgi:hypothetical protein